METKERCSKRVYGGNHRFGGEGCGNPAVALRTVRERKWAAAPDRYDEETFTFVKGASTETVVEVERWYCGTHDPERKAAREAKKDAERRAARRVAESVVAEATRLCEGLGVGTPTWDRHFGRYTGGVSLTASEARTLVLRLRTAEERVREYEAR